MKIDAILWDYDGTLVHSAPKNIAITLQILDVVAPRLTGNQLPQYLKSEEAYHFANHQAVNWQDLYVNYYGMTTSEMLLAGTLWSEYQRLNTTPVAMFPFVKECISQIQIPQAICSQNSSENILRVLKQQELEHKFTAIIGYDDIPSHVQKPHPFGGLKCLRQMFQDQHPKTVCYIGDHEGDVIFARNMARELQGQITVIAIAATYSGANVAHWKHQADFEMKNPNDLIALLKKLDH